MPGLIVSFLVLALSCFIAPIIDPARASAFGMLDVATGSLVFFGMDTLLTCMSSKESSSPWRFLWKFFACFAAFAFLWTPYTAAPAFDLIWLASLSTTAVYAYREMTRVFFVNGPNSP